MVKKDIEDKILELLVEMSIGLAIEDVAKLLKINRGTASKYLSILEAKQLIIVRELGKAKLHYPKTKKITKTMEEII